MGTQGFEMISLEEFAKRMAVSRSTVFAWLAKGYLAEGTIYVRVGKTIRFIWSLETVTALTLKSDALAAEESDQKHVYGYKQKVVNLDY